jgi:hypothetical protein
MDEYESPTPLEMAFDGTLEQYVRFDVSLQELLMLQEKD